MAPHSAPTSMAKQTMAKRARMADTDANGRIDTNERVTKFKREHQSPSSSNALNTNNDANLSATAATGRRPSILQRIELPECIIHHILEWADLSDLACKIYESPKCERLCPVRLWRSFYNGSLPEEMQKRTISHNAQQLRKIHAHYLAQVPDEERAYRRCYVSDVSAKVFESFEEETSIVMRAGTAWWEFVSMLHGVKLDIKYTSYKEAAFWSRLSQIVRSLQTFFLNMHGRSEIATFVESLPDHVVEWHLDDDESSEDESSEDGSSDEYLSDSAPDTDEYWMDDHLDHQWYE